jgi:hypothetical protein
MKSFGAVFPPEGLDGDRLLTAYPTIVSAIQPASGIAIIISPTTHQTQKPGGLDLAAAITEVYNAIGRMS